MKLKKLLTSVFFISIFSGSVWAQDIHFTMWDMAPLTVNPAFTGAYSGTARIGGIYRDQWRSIDNAGVFSTPSLYIDAPLIRGFRKNDWIGAGFMLFQDKAGTFELGYSAMHLSGAYHLGLNKKSTSVLTIGFQGGRTSRNLDIAGSGKSVDTEIHESFHTGDEKKTSYTDYTAGLLLKSDLGKKSDMTIGFSVGHLSMPEYNFKSSPSDTLPDGTPASPSIAERDLLTKFHAQFNFELNEKMTLSPQGFFQTEAGSNEITLQSYLGYKLNKNYTLRPGLGFRAADTPDLQILAGIDFKDNLRIAAAWDYNLGELSGNSSFEIGAWYIIKIFKKPDVKPAILCPKI